MLRNLGAQSEISKQRFDPLVLTSFQWYKVSEIVLERIRRVREYLWLRFLGAYNYRVFLVT